MFRMTIRRERGPGGFNAGKDKRTHTSRKRIDFSRFGIPLPSKRRVRRNKPGFTAASGIIRNLLMSILRIADSQNACCYVKSSNIKAIVIALTRDGLGLKPSVEIMQSRKEAEAEHRQSNLRLREGTLDAIHVGKCLRGSLANWWLVIDDFRVNLVMLRTLRQDYKSETGRDLRQAITLESVRHRDKMSTKPVAEICSERCLSVLESIQSRCDLLCTRLYQRNTDSRMILKLTSSKFQST